MLHSSTPDRPGLLTKAVKVPLFEYVPARTYVGGVFNSACGWIQGEALGVTYTYERQQTLSRTRWR